MSAVDSISPSRVRQQPPVDAQQLGRNSQAALPAARPILSALIAISLPILSVQPDLTLPFHIFRCGGLFQGMVTFASSRMLDRI